ncbi:MAG: hypothetical protein P8J89_07995 [Phycisphaerales bacterium]|nr:hypothetical protein [Phycisphaerales bacterium]
MSRRFTAIPVLLFLTLAALLLLGPGGCYTPGGGLFAASNSPFTYISTAEYPKTFVLVNTKTGENIFEMNIPAGKALVIKFLQGQGDEPATTPDLMKYGVFPMKDISGLLSSSMTVPGSYSRRIDIFLTTGETYTPPDEDRPIRTDTKEDRPPGWTSEGGPSDEVAPDPMNFYDP